MASEYELLKIGLLVQIANTVAPSMQTDFQTLLSLAQTPGYLSSSNASMAQLLELALLNLIAQNVGTGGGGGAPDFYNAAGPPNQAPPAYQNIVVDSNGRQWQYYGGAWN